MVPILPGRPTSRQTATGPEDRGPSHTTQRGIGAPCQSRRPPELGGCPRRSRSRRPPLPERTRRKPRARAGTFSSAQGAARPGLATSDLVRANPWRSMLPATVPQSDASRYGTLGLRTARRREPEAELLRRYAAERSPALREELVRRFMPLARSLAMRYRRQTESLDDLVQVAGPRPGQGDRRLRPRRGQAVRRLRGADDPRRAAPPLPRPRLDRAPAARAPGADDEGRRRDHRADRGARPPADRRRDRRAPRRLGRGRARGDRGRPRAAHPVARRAAPRGRTATPARRSSRCPPRSPATTGSRPSSRPVGADLDDARVGGPADALRRRAHPERDRRAPRRLADADLADQPRARCGSCSPPSAAKTADGSAPPASSRNSPRREALGGGRR